MAKSALILLCELLKKNCKNRLCNDELIVEIPKAVKFISNLHRGYS